VVVFREHDVLRASSPLFCVTFLIGSIAVYMSLFTWMLYQNDATCAALPWVLCTGFVLMFGSLLARTWRIFRIFLNPKFSYRKITNTQLVLFVGLLLGIQWLLLVLWTSIERRTVVVEVPEPHRPSYNYYQCTFTTVDIVFLSLIGAYWGALLAAGVFLAFKIRNVEWVHYNESKLIGFSIYNICVFSIVVMALLIADLDDRELSFVFRSVGVLLAAGISVLSIFLSKVYFVAMGTTPAAVLQPRGHARAHTEGATDRRRGGRGSPASQHGESSSTIPVQRAGTMSYDLLPLSATCPKCHHRFQPTKPSKEVLFPQAPLAVESSSYSPYDAGYSDNSSIM